MKWSARARLVVGLDARCSIVQLQLQLRSKFAHFVASMTRAATRIMAHLHWFFNFLKCLARPHLCGAREAWD